MTRHGTDTADSPAPAGAGESGSSRARRRVARPDGPRGGLGLVGLRRRAADPTGFFADLAARYPRIAYLRLGPERVYVLSAPDLVRDMLTTWGRVTTKGRGLQQARRLLGDGLLTSEGELHRRQRRLVQPAFHAARVEEYAAVMVDRSRAVRDRWRAGEVVDMAAEMSALTFDIVGRTLFGADLADSTAAVGTALTTVLGGFERSLQPGFDLRMRLPLPSTRRFTAAAARLDKVVARLIAEHRAAGDTGDLLSLLLAAQDDGAGMSDRQVRDEALTLLLAGHETTANALTWAWYLLSVDEPALRWLREELDTLPAAGPSGAADLPRLPRTRAVVAEAMRLYPPAWVLGRRLTADVTADGWTLPAGSLVVTSPWALHRDGRWWQQPLQFRPWRWTTPDGRFDEHAPGQPRFAYLPFGAGSRQCIGESFAWAEATLALATLADRHLPAYAGDGPPGTRPAITLRPAGPVAIRLTPAR